jgi:hypothetical protein
MSLCAILTVTAYDTYDLSAVSIDISGALGRPAAQNSECEKKFFFQKGD